MAQGAKNLTAAAQIAVEVQVRFPSGSSGIQCCCSCGVDHSCSLDSAPGPGTFLCRGFSHEEEKEEGGGGGGDQRVRFSCSLSGSNRGDGSQISKHRAHDNDHDKNSGSWLHRLSSVP